MLTVLDRNFFWDIPHFKYGKKGETKMANLQIFAFEGTDEIRTLLINDEPYFVGKDVAEVLGYGTAVLIG